MVNPKTQRQENNLAILAGLYPAAFAMAAASNSHFNLAAQRLVLPALPARLPAPRQYGDSNFLQFTVRGYAAKHQLVT